MSLELIRLVYQHCHVGNNQAGNGVNMDIYQEPPNDTRAQATVIRWPSRSKRKLGFYFKLLFWISLALQEVRRLLKWTPSCSFLAFFLPFLQHFMNSMKLVIRLYSLYWSIHTKDESKRGTAFAFIFGVNWLWRCGVTASFGVFFHELKCNGMTSFMEFMLIDGKLQPACPFLALIAQEWS